MNINKLIWAVVGAVAFGLHTGLSDGTWTSMEKIATLALVLGAFGAWLIPNTTLLATAKTWVSAITAGVGLVSVTIEGGLTGQEWLDALILVLTTAGVYVIPGPAIASVVRAAGNTERSGASGF